MNCSSALLFCWWSESHANWRSASLLQFESHPGVNGLPYLDVLIFATFVRKYSVGMLSDLKCVDDLPW